MTLRTTIAAGASVLAVGAGAATVLGFAGRWWWLLDLLAHFRVQYLAVLAVAAGMAFGLRRWRTGAAAVVGLGVNLAVVAPLWLGSAAAATDVAPLRIVAFNVHVSNTHHGEILDYLAAADADVVIVYEVSPALAQALGERFGAYQAVIEPAVDSFGIAMFARGKVEFIDQFTLLERSALPSAHVVVEKAGQRYAVLAVHTMPPVGSANSALRDDMLAAAARWARAQTASPVVIGDFNATPWSHAFRALLDDGVLVNSQRGYGIAATWGPWPLRIPIDHCVHAPSLTTVSRRLGPAFGSDHLPLHVELAPAR